MTEVSSPLMGEDEGVPGYPGDMEVYTAKEGLPSGTEWTIMDQQESLYATG